MIQEILPNSDTKLRILKIIYKNPGINFSTIVKKSRTSPNIVLKYVNELVKNNVLKEKRLGGTKKTHIRLFQPNLSELGINIFSYVEISEKEKFFNKYTRLKPIMNQLEELIQSSKIKFCLVYGSFARFAADKESDLDLWIVGKIDEKTKNRMREIFSTLNREYNLTIETANQFLKKITDPIHQNMINDHIIIYGEREFLKIFR